ncbi:MAG: hypothetical protein L0Y43_10510 [Methylococcaceae bacterium]|nr:hypothetical protein [Methylococcaceae bacterium]
MNSMTLRRRAIRLKRASAYVSIACFFASGPALVAGIVQELSYDPQLLDCIGMCVL